MRNVFIVIGLLSIMVLGACSATKTNSSKEIIIEEANTQKFVKGKQNPDGKNSGVHYIVRFTEKKDVEVLDFWIHDLNIDFDVRSQDEYIKLIATKYSDYTKNQNPQKDLPFEYAGEALIKYQIGDKVKYLIVEEFAAKQSIQGV